MTVHSTIETLGTYLNEHGLNDVGQVTALLIAAWDHLLGAQEEAMASHKLRRIETPAWDPPILSFTIERHGATVLGSSRAVVQRWTINLDAATADFEGIGARQLRSMNKQLDVQPLAREIAQAIEARADDPRVRWHGDVAHPVLARIIPGEGLPKQTVEGRRRRLREALEREMALLGWTPVGRGRYARSEGTL
jgi:hypothetical protein